MRPPSGGTRHRYKYRHEFRECPLRQHRTGKFDGVSGSAHRTPASGFRVDADLKGAHFIGYNEFDFLETAGSNNLGVTNGAFVPRIRLLLGGYPQR